MGKGEKHKKAKDHKAEKKHKKHKKSHKSEKKHKKSNKSHKRTKRDTDDAAVVDGSGDAALGLELSQGLVQYPELFSELASMLASLDSGEMVNIRAISNEGKRAFLQGLFEKNLPVLLAPQGGGWYKQEGIASVSGFVLMSLLSAKQIVQPTALSPAQALASRTAPLYLLQLLERCPGPQQRRELVADLRGLFSGLERGDAVQLDGLDDEDVAEGLQKLLGALGLRQGADGYALDGHDSKAAVGLVLSLLDRSAAAAAAVPPAAAAPGVAAGAGAGSSSSSSSSSSESESESDDEEEEKEKEREREREEEREEEKEEEEEE
jgi:hypothetical protein